MSQQQDPYPLDESAPGSQAPASKAKIEKPGLMEGFEEDADFTKDPELDRVVLGEPLKAAVVAPASAGDSRPEFVKQWWPWEDKFWAAAGGLLLLGALIASGINVFNAPDRPVFAMQRILNVLLTLYYALIHTGTGVAAVFLTAMLLGHRVGRVETATARMFAAVSAFLFLYSLRFTITSGRTEEVVFGAVAYLAVVAGSFRLLKRDPFLLIIGLHFAVWLIVQIGMLLSAAAKGS
jgi:hypothetical protein